MIRNLRTKKVLAPRSATMHSLLQKAIGLMGKGSVDTALVFPYGHPQRMQLHMFFVFTSIDVLFLDEKHHVVEKATLKPFTWYESKAKATTFIELPPHAARQTRVGDRISF